MSCLWAVTVLAACTAAAPSCSGFALPCHVSLARLRSRPLAPAARGTHANVRCLLRESQNGRTAVSLPLEKTAYKHSMLASLLQRFLAQQLSGAAALSRANISSGSGRSDRKRREEKGAAGPEGGSEAVVFDSMICAALEVTRLPGAEARRITLQLLLDIFPAWFVPKVKGLFALFPLWFVARHAAVFSVILTYWLVGKSQVQDVDPAVLDADDGNGWGNVPSGWVPGFALGSRWKSDLGGIERCRVLETSGCASVCANVCKAPTQDFFTIGVGLLLTMVPDYETQSCTLIFGATPPPIESDGAYTHGCECRSVAVRDYVCISLSLSLSLSLCVCGCVCVCVCARARVLTNRTNTGKYTWKDIP